jgi:hypothetical protein
MVVLPDLVAVPIVLPELSRNVCWFWACAVPVTRSSAIPAMMARVLIYLSLLLVDMVCCLELTFLFPY